MQWDLGQIHTWQSWELQSLHLWSGDKGHQWSDVPPVMVDTKPPHTVSWQSQLFAHNSSTVVSPGVITDCSPLSSKTHLHKTISLTSNQPDITSRAIEWDSGFKRTRRRRSRREWDEEEEEEEGTKRPVTKFKHLPNNFYGTKLMHTTNKKNML